MNTMIVIVLISCAIIGHELAHALTGFILGYKLKKIYLGWPVKWKILGFSPIIFKRQLGNTEVGISLLLMGGMVDFHDFDKPPFWKISLIALAGPVSNFLFALVPMIIVFGPAVGWSEVMLQVNYFLMGIGLLASGNIPLSSMTGLAGTVAVFTSLATGYHHGWLLVWLILNISLAVFNIFPIPALDGGHILMSAITSVLSRFFGEKYAKAGENVSKVFLQMLTILMIVVMLKDILW